MFINTGLQMLLFYRDSTKLYINGKTVLKDFLKHSQSLYFWRCLNHLNHNLILGTVVGKEPFAQSSSYYKENAVVYTSASATESCDSDCETYSFTR